MNAEQYLEKGMNESIIQNDSGWIILYKGERISLRSGKKIWNKKGHASSALKFHVQAILNEHWYQQMTGIERNTPGYDITYRSIEKEQEKATQYLLDNHIEFVELKVSEV